MSRNNISNIDGNILDPFELKSFLVFEADGLIVSVDLQLAVKDNRAFLNDIGASRLRNLVTSFSLSRRSEIDDLLEIFRCRAEQQAQAAGDPPQIPYVNDRDSEVDMTHALAPDSVVSNLNAAVFAHNAFELRPGAFVLAAATFITARRPENPFAEQTIYLRSQRPVVDCLGLQHFAF